MDGILLINKETGFTSRDVVNMVSKLLKTKKIGHTGTLDPLATGVLVLCIGSATKLVEIATSFDKEYIAEVTLGLKTDTLDITGNILEEQITHLEKENIIKAIEDMKGKYNQEVPIYSAVKINGKKLYEYARENIDINLPSRQVDIKNIELVSDIKYIDNKTVFQIKCLVSKGTYIRSLVKDLALKLNTIGVMSKLTRTKQGNFDIIDCYKIKDIENDNYNIIDIKEILKDKFKVVVDNKKEAEILNGKIMDNIYNSDEILFVNEKDELLSIYKIYEKDTSKIKPWKMLKK